MSKNIENDLKPTSGDLIMAGVRGLVGTVPFMAELLDVVFSSPIEKRKDEWLIQLAKGLEELREQVGEQKLENLTENEVFQTIVLDATNIAIRTHQEMKRKALCNACINTVKEIDISEDKKLVFIRLIDQLTEIDLKLLLYFEDPLKRFDETDESFDKSVLKFVNLRDIVCKFYPELEYEDEFLENRIKNLHDLGLINIENINTIMTLNEVYEPRLTELGREFISFIKETV
ncbi:hypothetical protein [Clostridium perfringens]|uniref:hypothetical protein n=1 Tax=Clostridium perfringens TaxID=1502 RepID=UPI0013E2FD5E|nr:hypothetical protein [Clostridium perfringens]MDK0690095.1 hypothetical protein [Clostridium perfringens]MDM0746493.1 hypothetical protein [Clostridium perfringens]MDM0749385.1 hypothetical protein [Clostridium perfringens]MDM0787037.1 hypothetical protein [Clostridium perfringens]MDU6144471.1 hypothetical protein [Clostridium perfringens]